MSQTCLLCFEHQVNKKHAHIHRSNVGLLFSVLYDTNRREVAVTDVPSITFKNEQWGKKKKLLSTKAVIRCKKRQAQM